MLVLGQKGSRELKLSENLGEAVREGSMQALTRRELLSRLCLAGAAGLWWLSPAGAPPSAARPRNSEHNLWSSLVGQPFALEEGPDLNSECRTILVLQEASLREYKNDRYRPTNLRPAAISLLFSSSAATVLTGATYTLTHPRLGEVPLLLNRIPRAKYAHAATYEAVLN